ncbi:putative 28S ribosomal protein S6, mitochondrial, partial [Trichinella pseudospiralis]
MPFYDIVLIMKPVLKVMLFLKMQLLIFIFQADLVSIIKRCCVKLMDNGAVLKSINSMGYKDLPFKMKKDQAAYITGSYVLLNCALPYQKHKQLSGEFRRDSDIIHSYFKYVETKNARVNECTLQEELEIPAYRKSVAKLQKTQKVGRHAKNYAELRIREIKRAIPKSATIAPLRE